MDQEDQLTFINDFLVPEFEAHGISTLIYLYDHNWDNVAFPAYILSNLTPAAYEYVAGTAYHCYGGSVEN